MFEIPDIEIPIYIFLLIFLAYMLVYVIYSLFNIYHLIRYGVYGMGLYLIVSIFTGGTILLVAGATSLLTQYNWIIPISLDTAAELYNENILDVL